MLASSALIALTTLIAKVLGLGGGASALHPLQISAGRFFFAFLVLALLASVLRPSLTGARWSLHVARSACGWIGITCLFAAASKIPLASATAIGFLSPVVTVALAIVFLSERVGVWRWSAVAIAVVGAFVLIRPGTEAFHPAALLALAAALAMGIESILIKKLTRREPAMRILLINNCIGATVALAAASLVWVAPSPEQWALLALLGVAMAGGQALFIQALMRGDASYVTPIFYSTLVYAALYDLALFGVVPDGPALAGAGLIAVGVCIIAFRQERVRARPEEVPPA